MAAATKTLALELPVRSGGVVALGRRALWMLVVIGALAVGIAAGVGLGVITHAVRFSAALGLTASILLIAGADALGKRLRSPATPRTVRIEGERVTVDGLGTIARGDLRHTRYDALGTELWLLGPLGWPMLCLEITSLREAVRVCDALGVPDRGVRTHRAQSLPVAVPYVGWLFLLVAVCTASFAVVMLLGGPLRVALVGLAIAAPFATAFVPARIHVGDHEIVRTWLGTRRIVRLADVRSVSIAGDTLVLDTAGGARRWPLRFSQQAQGQGLVGSLVAQRMRARIEAADEVLVAMIEARSGDAVAKVFE